MTESTIQPYLIESMLVRLMRTPQALQEVLGILQPNQFQGPEEQHYALLWEAIQQCQTRYSRLEYHTLYDTVQLLATQRPNLPSVLLDHILQESPTPGLMRWAFFNVPQDKLELDVTREMARLFLRERYVYQPLTTAVAAGLMHKLPEILVDTTQRQQRLLQVDVNPVMSAMPDDWAPQPLFLEPTGCSYLDVFMDGGHAAPEVNGILGPTGTGKTMLAVNLCVGVASRQLAMMPLDNPKRRRRVYLVTYEQSAEEIRKRLLSCAAHIAAESLRETTNFKVSLSSRQRGDYKAYERDRQFYAYGPDAPQLECPGEFERMEAARPLLRDVIQIIDLSGVGAHSRPGVGYVEEIAGLIDADQQLHGNPGVAVVAVDYVLLAAQRYMAANGIKSDNTRHAVGGFVDKIKQQVAGRFHTPVWLLHQLNNEGNKGSPIRVTSHTQAAESGAFATALTFCACLSTKDIETNCCLINFSKRRRAGDYVAPIILHIRGSEATIEDGGDRFAVDTHAGRIVTRTQADQFQGGGRQPRMATTAAHERSADGVLAGTS